MGFGADSLTLVRKLFKQSEYNQPPFIPSSGYSIYTGVGSTAGAFGFDYLNTNTSIFGLQDYTRIEQDLIARYVDYEDQDESPLISSAYDIYSDDATQTDTLHNYSIWIEAADEEIRSDLMFLLHKQLNIEEKLWPMTRTLVKYGNNFAELVARDGQGVLAMNHLPPPTMRRIEIPAEIGKYYARDYTSPETVGFIYDPKGVFKISTREFINEIASRMSNTYDPNRVPLNTSVFENWEIVHSRLLGKRPDSIYGWGVGEPARWIYKRLVLLEDSVILHRLCLRGDTNVWTTSGYKKIRDIEEGDEVYSYSEQLKLKKTKVVYKKNNGQDKVYRIYSKHREIFANATHPILMEVETHNGSGRAITRTLEYVEVKDIEPGKHKFVQPEVEDKEFSYVFLNFPTVPCKARLKSEFAIPRPQGLFQIGRDCGVEYGRLKRFIAGNQIIPEHTARNVVKALGIKASCLEIIPDWGNLRQVSIPEVVNEDFARLFGFMLGDGFLASKKHKSGYVANNNVGIALGSDERMNEKYIALFSKFFGPGYLAYKGNRKNSYSINSKTLYEFFELNGYIKGAGNKRIPQWLFQCNKSIRLAFIQGLVDADGHRKLSRGKGLRNSPESLAVVIEMCNEALLEDLRELCMQTGLSVGKKIHNRKRKGGHTLEGRVMAETTAYALHFSFTEHYDDRTIMGVEQVEDDDVWDIGVRAKEHNFVANGVVVHNTRAPSRYAFYVDVTGIPPQETNGYLNKVRQGMKRQKFINPSTGKLDLRYQPLCLSLSTKIPLLNGKTKTLAELIKDHENGIKNYTYSINRKTFMVVPGEISWAGITRKNAELVKVIFSNGFEEIVTPDHKFMNIDGEYVEAQDLKRNQIMMPFTRSIDPIDGFDYVTHMRTDEIQRVDKMVMNYYTPFWMHVGAQEDVYHEDGNPANNYPENLAVNKPKFLLRLLKKNLSQLLGKVLPEPEPELKALQTPRYPRVARVERLDYIEDTGCICVNKWHNFALQSGVFVKNSPDEDFFLGVRDGRESTRIEPLAGPIYDAIEDIKYFENKLFAALKVPKPFLTYEESTAKTNLSAEDARFARTIIRIQRELKSSIRKVCEVHLAARGINPTAIDFTVEMTLPSAIFELAQLEIRSAELELADKFQAYAPMQWIMTNVLGFSEEQLEEFNQMKAREEEAGTGGKVGGGGGGSGALEKALSKRGRQKESSLTSDRKFTSGKNINTSSLLERIEELRSKNKEFDHRWSQILSFMRDIQSGMKR